MALHVMLPRSAHVNGSHRSAVVATPPPLQPVLPPAHALPASRATATDAGAAVPEAGGALPAALPSEVAELSLLLFVHKLFYYDISPVCEAYNCGMFIVWMWFSVAQ